MVSHVSRSFLRGAIQTRKGCLAMSGGEFGVGIREMAWRPISTAPKDGTEIIAVFSDDYGYQDKPTVYGPWTVSFDGRRQKWVSSWDGYRVISSQTDFGTDYHDPDIDPTHWMPMPPPPAPAPGTLADATNQKTPS
jgi:hypothetical protein